jgi:predicted ArsR family transcriptional regulator
MTSHLMPEQARFTFLTSHSFVLLALDRQPDLTMREVADAIGITQRQVHRIIDDLEAAGYITRHLAGRKNHYTVNRSRPSHDSSLAGAIGHLLEVLQPPRA